MIFRKFIMTFLVALAAVASVSAHDAKRQSKWARLDGSKIHYYDIGKSKQKKALVLIHGWTCTADFWKESFDAFPDYRILAIDLPGHGQSDKPKVDYSMAYFARSVDAVMRQAGVKSAVLVGHSMGTPVAREFYRLHPQQTLGIVVVDGALQSFFPKAMMEQFIAQLRTNYKESEPKMVDGMLAPIKDAGLKQMIRDSMLATPDYVGVSAMDAMADEKIWTTDKINVPVLAIMAASPMWPSDLKERYMSIAPKMDFQVWNDVSHFLFMEKPKDFNEQVRAFVSKNKLL
ncbi:MAG: alpha/beta hydrolase [Pyrinomonadaceae bacterium]